MIRQIIKIDREKCNGCGLCVNACKEGAIGLIDGKAELLRDDYCDGLGNCLPVCPTDAITFEEREALSYDEKAVTDKKTGNAAAAEAPFVCPGSRSMSFDRPAAAPAQAANVPAASELRQWPVQIKLVSPAAPYFRDADLLIAADCTAYACGDFHSRFMKNRVTLVGCPKLDGVDYAEKLTDILVRNEIKSVTVVRMEVPCCGGIVKAVTDALRASGKLIPWRVVTLSTEGRVLEDR